MYKSILISFLPLVASVILSMAVGNYGIGRIRDLRSQISQASKDELILTQKLSTLQSLSSTVATGSKVASSALPEKNSSLITLSQIKILASKNGLTLSKIRSSSSTQESGGLTKAEISFEMTGIRATVMAFLDEVQKIAPITIVGRVKLNEDASSVIANVNVTTFSAGFPKNIPSITEPIKDLTADEKNTLSRVSGLIQPQFVDIPASTTGGKSDPFAQ